MIGKGKDALMELARIVVAVVAAVGGSFGYLELAGPSRILANVDQAKLESLARPDRWTGDDGRANTAAISGLQLEVSSLELRVNKVDRIEEKLDRLSELVTELRIVVGRRP